MFLEKKKKNTKIDSTILKSCSLICVNKDVRPLLLPLVEFFGIQFGNPVNQGQNLGYTSCYKVPKIERELKNTYTEV